MCSHSHCCSEKKSEIKESFSWVNIVCPALILIFTVFIDLPKNLSIILYLFAYLWAGYDILLTSFKNEC